MDDNQLADLAKRLPSLDVDPSSAQRIVQIARRGPARIRLVLPIIVGIVSAITLVWALIHAYQTLG
jgi:hypothetical protein